jgi:hypothetical protein
MMGAMNGRRWVRTGAVVTVVAVAGLAVYFMVVGLETADKAASVVGGLAALLGLVLTAYGVLARSGGGGVDRQVSQRARASERGQATQVGGDQGDGGGSSESYRVDQRAKASGDGAITQVGGNQSPGT